MSSAIDAENRDAAKQQGEYDSAMKALEPYRVGKVPLGYAGPEPAENQYYIGKAIQDGVDRRALNIAFGKETVDQAEKALKELPKLPSSDLRSQFSKLTPEQQSRLPDVFGTAKVGPFTVSKEHEQEVRFGLGAIPGVNEAVFWNEMDNGQRATAIAIDIAVLAGPFLIAKALGALRGAQAARLAASLRNSDAGLDTLKSFDSSLVKPVQAVNAAKADYVASRMRVADLEKTLATTQSKAAPAHMVSEFQKGPIINELADVERSLEIARASAQDARATLAAKAQVVSTKLLDAKPFESFPSPQVRGQATKAIQNLPRSVVENTDSMIESTIKPKTARGIPEIQADLKQAQARLSAAAEKGYNTEPLRRDIMGLKGELLVQNVAEIQVLERAARNQTNLVYQLEKMKRPPGTFSAAEEPRLALSVEDQLKAVRTEQKAIGEQLNAAYKRMRKLEVEGEARGGGIATRTRIIPITERPTMLTTAEGKRIKIGIPTGKTIGGGVSSAKPKEVIASFITAKGQPIVITKPVTSVTPSEVPGIEPARRGKESTNPEEIPSIKPMSANQPRQASQTKTDTKTTQEIKTGEISKPGGGIESSGKPTPKVEPQPKAETRTPTKPKIPERIKTPDKPKEPIKFPKRKTLGEQQALIERAARDGAITWKQGALHEPQYKLWVYPYDKGDFTTVSSIPKGANLVSGIGSARKTAKVLRGKAPDTAKTADIGAFLATVTPVDREKRKISVTFRPDPANKIHIRTGQTLVEVHRRPIRVVPPTRRPPRLPRVDADLHSLRRGKIFYTPMRGGVALSRHSLGRRGRRK